MAANVVSLKKKRAQAEKLAEVWQKRLQNAVKKMAHYQRRSKLYTTLIENALSGQAPKDPKRVVEV